MHGYYKIGICSFIRINIFGLFEYYKYLVELIINDVDGKDIKFEEIKRQNKQINLISIYCYNFFI